MASLSIPPAEQDRTPHQVDVLELRCGKGVLPLTIAGQFTGISGPAIRRGIPGF